MFRIDQILELGLYDEKFLLHEDREFRIRFEKNIKFTEYLFHCINIEDTQKT